jgi:serine/threonine protein kinase
MARAPLKRFGSYALLSRLAKGGMGEVFIARHGELAGMQKLCVVKTLRADMSQDKEYAARFFDEARLVVQLSHRNICQVFDVGRVGDRFYLGMELVGGVDLRTLIDEARARNGALQEPIALFIASEMLEALSYAHRRTDPTTGASLQIVHRDVSPQNVMVSFEGEVKLIDFGLAASTMKQERTQVNRVMGKLNYMSPEQARGGDVDERTDIFAAAVLTYELLTGERYYEGKSHDEVWNVAGRGTYRAPKLSTLHKGLSRILEGALAAKVDERTPTAEAFREAIEAYLFARGYRPTPSDLRAYLGAHIATERAAHQSLMGELVSVDDEPHVPVEESRSLLQAPRMVPAGLHAEPTQIRARTSSEAPSATDSETGPLAVVDVKPEAVPEARIAGRPEAHPTQQPTTRDVDTAVVERLPFEAPPSRSLLSGRMIAIASLTLVGITLATVALVVAQANVGGDDEVRDTTAVVVSASATGPTPTAIDTDSAVADDAGVQSVDAGGPILDTKVTKTPPPKRKRAARRGPRPPARTSSPEAKLAFLKKNCADVTCTATALSIRPRATWTAQEKFRYDNILSSCVSMCAE